MHLPREKLYRCCFIRIFFSFHHLPCQLPFLIPPTLLPQFRSFTKLGSSCILIHQNPFSHQYHHTSLYSWTFLPCHLYVLTSPITVQVCLQCGTSCILVQQDAHSFQYHCQYTLATFCSFFLFPVLLPSNLLVFLSSGTPQQQCHPIFSLQQDTYLDTCASAISNQVHLPRERFSGSYYSKSSSAVCIILIFYPQNIVLSTTHYGCQFRCIYQKRDFLDTVTGFTQGPASLPFQF